MPSRARDDSVPEPERRQGRARSPPDARCIFARTDSALARRLRAAASAPAPLRHIGIYAYRVARSCAASRAGGRAARGRRGARTVARAVARQRIAVHVSEHRPGRRGRPRTWSACARCCALTIATGCAAPGRAAKDRRRPPAGRAPRHRVSFTPGVACYSRFGAVAVRACETTRSTP